MNSKQKYWARFFLGCIACGAIVLGSSLYVQQVVKGSAYSTRAQKQYVKLSASLFDRGSIFFQAKDSTHISAATVESGYVVYMNPTLVTAPQDAYRAVSQYLTLDQKDFVTRAGRAHDAYEELARKVDEKTALAIKSLGLPGIGVLKQSWRAYPGDELAASTLGIIGEGKDGTIQGQYGLEDFYEKVLNRPSLGSGTSGFAELFSGVKGLFQASDDTHGDVVTTIEPTVQGYIETILGKTKELWHPDEIGAVVIDPMTGEIKALATLPSFNPNDTSHLKDVSVLSNPLVEKSYEMGSIIKPLTIATGLDTGVIVPTSTYDDTGTMTLNAKKFSNYDGKARGPNTPVQEILSQSLNIGAATVALKVDADKGKGTFAKYFYSLLSTKSGIDLPHESASLISSLKSGRDIEIATASFGQGIAMSPIETVRALSTIANGGYLITPHIAKEIDHEDGTHTNTPVSKTGPLFKQETIDAVTRMLVKVVDDKMVAIHPTMKNEHYSVAAKTGTAQIADHVNGGYYKDRYLHSFFGYFPAYNPKFLVFLYQIYPKNANFASETLTDPFSEIEKFLINYYNVPPDR
ncbi:MAG: penicillin-binding protein 2 [Candidatus Taylorbacteria bacterium]